MSAACRSPYCHVGCPALPCPALPCPALPCPALPCPALPCPALPCPALPCPALPCPALPCPALPALPCLPPGHGCWLDMVTFLSIAHFFLTACFQLLHCP